MSELSKEDTAEIAGVRISHAHKVYYPDLDITKLELAKYYQRVEDWILPELRDRPLSLVRMPEGITGEKFFQKHPTDSFPEYLERIKVKESEGTHEYIYADSLNDIIYLVNLGVLEFHTWGSKVQNVELPDRVVFDLDPDKKAPWQFAIDGAKLLKQMLDELDLVSFVKTSGGKGLHIVVPLKNKQHGWHEVKQFSRTIASAMVEFAPEKYTLEMRIANRTGKVFVDYLRNDRGATTVAPYSTRGRPGAAVSVPVFWEEVTPKLKPNQYNIHNLFRRLSRLDSDPWREIRSISQNLPL